MGRKKSGSGVAGVLVVVVILFAIMPKAIGVIIGLIVAICLVVHFVNKQKEDEGNNKSYRKNDENELEPIRFRNTYQNNETRTHFRIPDPPEEIIQNAKWVPAGESVTIAGYEINEGMIYVGSHLSARYGQQEPSLIDTTKKVARTANLSERLMGYWPSYSDISPEARGAYLQWLASGRKDPDADVGYVFLFFYGLERRVLIDSQKDESALNQIPAIRQEVERLLTLYESKSGSVRNYLSSFLQFLDLRDIHGNIYANPLPKLSSTYELPFYLRLALGQTAVDSVPVPVHLALAWVLYDPMISKKTPVTRCPEEFSKIFSLKYSQTFHDGLRLSVNKTKLKFYYRPASNALAGADIQTDPLGNIPDVAAVTGPQKKLQKIVDECIVELDSYSRFLGRNPDKKNAIESLLLLPPSLWPDTAHMELEKIKTQVDKEHQLITVSDLLGKFGDEAELSKDKLVSLAKALESEKIGMEPDIISYSIALKASDNILLYAMKSGVPDIRTTAAYQTAVLTLQLAAAVANSDGVLNENEILFLNQQIERWEHLSAYHLARLREYLYLLLKNPVSISTLKKKLENVQPDDRKTVVSFITQVALADGSVDPSEVSFLEKVYKAFEIDVAELYSVLHRGSGTVGTDNSISENAKPVSFVLDKARIASLRKDTENVSALLSDIFTEKVDENNDLEDTEVTNDNILGLDDSHAAFMRMILAKPVWTRQELEDIAKDLDLMLDGAIETINEASFVFHDCAVTEGDDPIEVNMEIREKVLV